MTPKPGASCRAAPRCTIACPRTAPTAPPSRRRSRPNWPRRRSRTRSPSCSRRASLSAQPASHSKQMPCSVITTPAGPGSKSCSGNNHPADTGKWLISVSPWWNTSLNRRKAGRLQDLVFDAGDDRAVLFGLRPCAYPLGIGLEGRPFLFAVRERFPFEEVIEGLVGIADCDGPEAGLLDTVALPDSCCNRVEPLQKIGQAAGHAVVDPQFVKHVVLSFQGVLGNFQWSRASTQAAASSSASSRKRWPTSWMPSGNPLRPLPPGRVRQGVHAKVQIALKRASPVEPSPFGASPGALGASSTSTSAKVSSRLRRNTSAVSIASV